MAGPGEEGGGGKRYLAKRVLKNWRLEKGRAASPGHLAFQRQKHVHPMSQQPSLLTVGPLLTEHPSSGSSNWLPGQSVPSSPSN